MAGIRTILGSLFLVLGGLLALSAEKAEADYSPVNIITGYTIFPSNGVLVQNQGNNLDEWDAAVVWAIWLDTNKISMGSSGCGSTRAYVIFTDEGSTLTWTSCTVPDLSNSNPVVWAQTFIIDDGISNIGDPDCGSLATDPYVIYVIVYNDDLSHSATELVHIARHEMAHALRLDHPASSVGCWEEWGYVFPLMKNTSLDGNCSVFGQNTAATANEISTVASDQTNW